MEPNRILLETKQILVENQDKSRKSYRKPQLVELGDLRTLTLGASNFSSWESGATEGHEWVYFGE